MNQNLPKKIRGKLVAIICVKCGHQLLIYQKIGAGGFKKLFLDRMIEINKNLNIQSKNLLCDSCNENLGTLTLYGKRKAYKVFPNKIRKGKIINK